MNDVFRRGRKAVAAVASLAIATTISLAAPNVASAEQANKAPTGTVQFTDLPAKGGISGGGGASTNDWTW